MFRMVYNKLVRDKIPEIIKESGANPECIILNEEEYELALRKKLEEEVAEFMESGSVEELADIQEVILALVEAKGVSRDMFEIMRVGKLVERGAFREKIFLKSVDE